MNFSKLATLALATQRKISAWLIDGEGPIAPRRLFLGTRQAVIKTQRSFFGAGQASTNTARNFYLIDVANAKVANVANVGQVDERTLAVLATLALANNIKPKFIALGGKTNGPSRSTFR